MALESSSKKSGPMKRKLVNHSNNSFSNFNLTYTERAITDYTSPYYLDHRSQMLDSMMSRRI